MDSFETLLFALERRRAAVSSGDREEEKLADPAGTAGKARHAARTS